MNGLYLLIFAFCTLSHGFHHDRQRSAQSIHLFAGKGFGKGRSGDSKETQVSRSYDDSALSPLKDLIDTEGAMKFFFESNDEWLPLFRSIMDNDASAPATDFIESPNIASFEFHEESSPWKRLEAIPTQDFHREVLADFLDQMQKFLIDIPVDELTKEDDNDLHFLEEGRRMLVCSRFHVIPGVEKGSIESYDSLFSTCWSEITLLSRENKNDTGSLIVVPGCELEDLRRFTDINLQRPLQWLGIDGKFEVASLQRGSPAIRLIHKLSEMPTDIPNEPENQ